MMNRQREPVPTLLILDDEVNITQALNRVFRREGYRVLLANTPTEAFDLLASETVQVDVCDQRIAADERYRVPHRPA